MINFAKRVRYPKIGMIQTSTSEEVSLENVYGADGKTQDYRFASNVGGIFVNIRKPIANTGTVNDEAFILRVSDEPGQVRRNLNAGKFWTATGDDGWWLTDVHFPLRSQNADGHPLYNFYFAVRDTRNITTLHWAAVTLSLIHI